MGSKSKKQNLQRRQQTAIVAHSVATYSGPLPTPDMLAQYNTTFPECAERIVTMAESQALHRQEIEKIFIHAAIKSESRGQIYGFIVALSAIIGGVIIVSNGKDVIGLTAIISALVALVGVFIYGKRQQNQELVRKNLGVSTPD